MTRVPSLPLAHDWTALFLARGVITPVEAMIRWSGRRSRVPSLPIALLAGEMLRIEAWLDSTELWTDDDIAAARGHRLSLAALLDEMPPQLRASAKGSLLGHASGPRRRTRSATDGQGRRNWRFTHGP